MTNRLTSPNVADLIVILLVSSMDANAQTAQSRYVKFDLDKCTVVERDEESGPVVQHCKDSGGFAFDVADGDLRFFLGTVRTEGSNARSARNCRPSTASTIRLR